MAAMRVCRCGCPCILRPAARHHIYQTRSLSLKSEVSSNESSNAQSQDKRKKRDRFTVLKALSSTVQKVPGPSNFGFLEDAYLTPRSDFTKREYIAAIESGRNAAEFIIRKYPDLCNLREPVPAWPDEFAVFEEKEDEETLQFLIESDKVDEAVKLYDLLQEKGENLSNYTLNLLLDFVGYYGVGIKETISETSESTAEKESSSSSSDSESSSDDEGQLSDESDRVKRADKTYGFKVKDCLLSEHGLAAKIFARITEKTFATYEAYILALLKHGEFNVACRVHDEMQEKNFKGSAYLYSEFINHIDMREKESNAKENWNIAELPLVGLGALRSLAYQNSVAGLHLEEFLSKMREDKSTTPDIGLYNALLKLGSKLGDEAPLRTGMLIREMISNGVEPSLGSYLYVLEANDARKSEKFAALHDIVHRIYSHKGRFEIQDTRDVEFLSAAMNLARSFGSAEVAILLMKIGYRDGNWTLLGRSSSAFLGNYIATLARAESNLDFVFNEYDRLVPNELVPRDWVYAELFRRLERGERPEKIFKLCNDMKVNRVRLTYPICERIFCALSAPLPKELLKDGLNAALETMKWMAMFDIPVTGVILGHVARLYSLNGMLNDALNTIELFDEKETKPSFAVVRSILDKACEMKDQRIAVKVAKKMAGYNYWLPEDQLNDIFEKLEPSESERSYFLALVDRNA